MTVQRMRIPCWIPKAINTHSRRVIILIAIPLQQWLHERHSKLRSTSIVCIVFQKGVLFIDLFQGALKITDCGPRGQTGRMTKRVSQKGFVSEDI